MNSFTMSGPAGETLTLTIADEWTIKRGLPSLAPLQKALAESPNIRRLRLSAGDLRNWDSTLPTFLLMIETFCKTFSKERSVEIDIAALPTGPRRLLELALAAPARTAVQVSRPPSLVSRVGTATMRQGRALTRFVTFLGDSVIAFVRFTRGRARYRPIDLFLMVQQCGAEALPIVSIISLLVGMIFAFVGAVQLKQFGADIYDANLVAVAMTREMAAVMTGIVLAGRTGAAFAAHIGAMQGNEEVDALSTLGISPVEFLVLPRMLALVVMTPLLCVYANAVGIFGGFIVGISTLNVTPTAYLLQTRAAVTIPDVTIGIVKSAVFGGLIAVIGCLRGIESGRSAAAVGAATTSAVVSSILAIIVADAIFAVLLNLLGL